MPPALRTDHPDVDWARPTQLRNRIVHGYWSVDMDILVTTASLDLPDYVTHLKAILDQLGY